MADTLPTVDVIVTSLNLVLPGAMLGEVTPEIVHAILGARATKVLLPLNRARVEIVGARALHPRGVDYAIPVPSPFFSQFGPACLAGSLQVIVVARPRGSAPVDESTVERSSWASHPPMPLCVRDETMRYLVLVLAGLTALLIIVESVTGP